MGAKPMRWWVAILFALLCACSSNDNAENTMNVDENLSSVDVNTVENAAENGQANLLVDENGKPVLPFTDPQDRGVGAFVEPPPMQVGKSYDVEFVVAPNKESLAEEAQGKATGPSKQIYLSPRMRVTLLKDEAFKTVAKTPAEQSIGLDKSATWQWSVSPLEGGDLELTAQVEVLDAKGEVADTYTKYVTVHAKVGGYQSFMSGTQHAAKAGNALTDVFKSWRETLLALAALIAAGFVVWRVIKNRGSGAQESDSGQK